jgi:hypothetical protein
MGWTRGREYIQTGEELISLSLRRRIAEVKVPTFKSCLGVPSGVQFVFSVWLPISSASKVVHCKELKTKRKEPSQCRG